MDLRNIQRVAQSVTDAKADDQNYGPKSWTPMQTLRMGVEME